jgi:hypothetical protein
MTEKKIKDEIIAPTKTKKKVPKGRVMNVMVKKLEASLTNKLPNEFKGALTNYSPYSCDYGYVDDNNYSY